MSLHSNLLTENYESTPHLDKMPSSILAVDSFMKVNGMKDCATQSLIRSW